MSRWKRWAPLGVVALTVAAVACAATVAKVGSPNPSTTEAVTTTSAPRTTTTGASSTTTSTTTAASTTTGALVSLTRTLTQGAKGDDVKLVQQRLKDLGFDPGKVDGQYGLTTVQSVWAFQHLSGALGSKASGSVTPDLWTQLQQPFALRPRTGGTDTHIEVYLPQQVVVVFAGGAPKLITHTSTGNNRDWCEKGSCGKAITPGGVYKFGGRYTGWQEGPLGKLYNPVYFNFGIAVHGALSVPNYPASHGCARIPMHIAEYFPILVTKGTPVFVYDGVKDPTTYGAQAPPWNTKDPAYIPPVTDPPATTTIPAPPTTTAPATTTGPTTTAPSTTTPSTTAKTTTTT